MALSTHFHTATAEAAGRQHTGANTSKRTNVRLWVTQVALAALFLFAGSGKLFGSSEAIAETSDFPVLLLRFIGACEVLGAIGLIVAAMPSLWVSLFTSDPGVTAAASSYLVWAGPAFAFFGMGVCLYFSSQGAAKVGGPVMAGTARLLIVGGGGWWLASAGAPAWTLFALVGLAMVVYGIGTALSIRLTRWGK